MAHIMISLQSKTVQINILKTPFAQGKFLKMKFY
jgi:hypothetical protein